LGINYVKLIRETQRLWRKKRISRIGLKEIPSLGPRCIYRYTQCALKPVYRVIIPPLVPGTVIKF